MRIRPLSALAALAMFAAPSAALAQDGSLSLELNTARDANGGCRITFIAVNGTSSVLDKTSYQVVVFDSEAKVSQFLILEFGTLPASKTKVAEFDFVNRACNQISRILVNDVSECVAAGAPSPVCMANLKTSTKTEIGFGI